MKKKLFATGIAIAMVLSMVGCGAKTTDTAGVGNDKRGGQAESGLLTDYTDETAFVLQSDDVSLGVKKIDGMNVGEMSEKWKEDGSLYRCTEKQGYMYNGATVEDSSIVYVYRIKDTASIDTEGGIEETLVNSDGTGLGCTLILNYSDDWFPILAEEYKDYDGLSEMLDEDQTDAYNGNSKMRSRVLRYVKRINDDKSLILSVLSTELDKNPLDDSLLLTTDQYYSLDAIDESAAADTIGHSEAEGMLVSNFVYNEETGDYDTIGGDREIVAKTPEGFEAGRAGGGFTYGNYCVLYNLVEVAPGEVLDADNQYYGSWREDDSIVEVDRQTFTNGDGEDVVARKRQNDTVYSVVEIYKYLPDENLAIMISISADNNTMDVSDWIPLMEDIQPEDYIDLTKDCYFSFDSDEDPISVMGGYY